jgi:ABC-type bacteriocin/lantibiotic exporter with double-glycine peptidase domain
MKLSYFRSALEKDAAYYDIHNQNEVATKISKECSAVQNGLGSKVGEIIGKSIGAVLGIIIAFVYCSEFTLLLIGFFPVLVFTALFYGYLLKKGMAEGMKKYAQSAGYAEQAL